jgi:hypothetical protein
MRGTVKAPARSEVQSPLIRAEFKIRLRRQWEGTATMRSGHLSPRQVPCNHGSVQNRMDLPFPCLTWIDAWDRAMVAVSSWIGILAHGLEGSDLWNHNHRKCNAIPMCFKSGMPGPPKASGLWIRFHATKHLPFCTTFILDHKKALLILWSPHYNQGGNSRLMAVYTGIANRVVLIRVKRPLLCISWPRHAGSLSATLSIKGWRALLDSLKTDKGEPKYLMGKDFSSHGKSMRAWVICSLVHRIGTNWLLSMLHARPEAAWKMSEDSPCEPEILRGGRDEVAKSTA